MRQATKVKANLLDQFYQHLDESDWLDGVDIYQAGHVQSLTTYEGLVTGKIAGTVRKAEEVRIKLHPSGHCIQWIECTCPKNRARGMYCEHIAAFMIHVDREKPEIFASLDTSMPIKAPTVTRRKTKDTTNERKGAVGTRSSAHATQTILEHLHGNIQSVSLLAGGPMLRVRIEIKEGQLTHYDLDLDQSAKFLENKREMASAAADVKQLQLFSEPVELGTRIYQTDAEKITAERVVAIRMHRKPSDRQLEKMGRDLDSGIYRRFHGDIAAGEEANYVFIPLKTATKYLGKEYFYIPEQGYWPIAKTTVSTDWYDLPLTKTFKDDDAAKFVQGNYEGYLGVSPIYLGEGLAGQTILEAPKLSEIKIVEERDGWFHLDPRYGDGKASISMIDLMKQHSKKKRKYIRSGNHWVKIPEFVTEHEWQLDSSGESIKVDALGLLRLRAAVGDFDGFVGSKKVLTTIRKNLEFSPEEGGVPKTVATNLNLRQYQEVGLKWLWWLYRNDLHGLLADEMGLGKTHQAMALLASIMATKPTAKFLVIAPTTVLDHWLDKIEAFAPLLAPMKYHGPKRTASLSLMGKGMRTMVTSYGVLLRDVKQLAEENWDAMILDEAHFVKNNDTATYKAACRIKSKIRLCLTGTPLENHLGELKSLFDFLVPGYLGSDEYFRKHFLAPIEQTTSPDTEIALQKLIHPFKMRRTKEQVLPDLPEKIEDIRHCSLSPEQIRLYRDVVALKVRPLVDQLQDESAPIPFLHVFATMTLLKQICNHPTLVSPKGSYDSFESGKFELLKELLTEALDSQHKVVIYSQYVEMIRLIRDYLTDQKIGHVVLTGQTRNRGEIINQFQTDPNTKIFVGSLLAGGIGIDLTAASVVIHYDRWWNASKENQATDRVHRIGQNKNVQVIKLVTRGTLEEKIDRMIASKAKLFEKFLDKDEEIFKSLTRQELIELLQ